MRSVTRHARAALAGVGACGFIFALGIAAAAPAQAVCTGAYFSVNTAAQASVKVPTDCTNSSQVRARKDWWYTDATNSQVGSSFGPWIGQAALTSTVFLPSGRFPKQNLIESK